MEKLLLECPPETLHRRVIKAVPFPAHRGGEAVAFQDVSELIRAVLAAPLPSEMPFIQDTSTDKKWVDEGLVVLAINIGESSSTVREHVNKYGLAFHVLLDITRDVSLGILCTSHSCYFFHRQTKYNPGDKNRPLLQYDRDKKKSQEDYSLA